MRWQLADITAEVLCDPELIMHDSSALPGFRTMNKCCHWLLYASAASLWSYWRRRVCYSLTCAMKKYCLERHSLFIRLIRVDTACPCHWSLGQFDTHPVSKYGTKDTQQYKSEMGHDLTSQNSASCLEV